MDKASFDFPFLLTKVNNTSPESCWIWKGGKSANGYGSIYLDGILYYAHRLVWEITNGPIPEGMFICHHCDNPICVNPNHLFCGTPKDNTRDMWSKSRQNNSFVLEPTTGENNSHAKLNRQQVIAIRELYKKNIGFTHRKLAKLFGVSKSSIGAICRYESWNDPDSPSGQRTECPGQREPLEMKEMGPWQGMLDGRLAG